MKQTSKSLRKEVANVHLCYSEAYRITCGSTCDFNQVVYVYRQEKAEIAFRIDKKTNVIKPSRRLFLTK